MNAVCQLVPSWSAPDTAASTKTVASRTRDSTRSIKERDFIFFCIGRPCGTKVWPVATTRDNECLPNIRHVAGNQFLQKYPHAVAANQSASPSYGDFKPSWRPRHSH